MGRSAGAGFPLTLRCAMCKKRRGYSLRRDESSNIGTNLVATGKTKPVKRDGHHTHGIRQANQRIEYRCTDCGHIGWSRHTDAERLLWIFQGPRRLEAAMRLRSEALITPLDDTNG